MSYALAKDRCAALIEAISPDEVAKWGLFRRTPFRPDRFQTPRSTRSRLFALYHVGADTWVDDPHPQKARFRDLLIEVFYPFTEDGDHLDDVIGRDYEQIVDALWDGDWQTSSTGIRVLSGQRLGFECEVDRSTFAEDGHILLRIQVALDHRSAA